MDWSRLNHSCRYTFNCFFFLVEISDVIQVQRLVCIYDYLFRRSKPPSLGLYQFHKAEKFSIWRNFFAIPILAKCWLICQKTWADLVELSSKGFINLKNEVVSDWFGPIIFCAGFRLGVKRICASLHPLLIDLCNLFASDHISPFDEIYIFL